MNGHAAFDITPTEQELKENGFLSAAQSELMRDKHRSEIERDFIDFPEAFTVDLQELYESGGLVLGSKHTGKSDVAMMICERAMRENTIVIVFDPSLDWIERSNIKRYMKPYRNLEKIPSESMIYDVSLLSPLEQQKIVEDFSKKLFGSQAQTRNRRQYLIVFEESHVYFPQGCMKAKRMQNSVKMLSVGRNVDIAALLISQFASMLDKFAIKHSTSQAWLNGVSKIQIEPYESNTPKTEIAIPEPKFIPIPEKPKQTNDMQAMASLFGCIMWFVVALVILSQI